MITFTNLLTARMSADQPSYTTATAISPAANKLVLAFITSSVTTGIANTPTITGGAVSTWTSYTSQASGVYKGTLLFGLSGAGGSAQAVIDFGGQTQLNAEWSFVEVSGTVLTGTNGIDAIVQTILGASPGNVTTYSLTLDNPLFGANSRTFAGMGTKGNRTLTATSPSTIIGTVTGGANGAANITLYSPTITTDIGISTSESAFGIAVELKALIDLVPPVVQRAAFATKKFHGRLN